MYSEIFNYIDPSPMSITESGLLSGKSVAIQPNISVSGWPTEAGSLALEDYVALENATIVERLRQSGSVIKGSTNMSELGFGLTGETGNKALAEGLVDITLITDTMGEARFAAATTSVFGFKPSYGIVSRFGLIGLVPSMESIGILANTPEIIAMVADVISDQDNSDFSMTDCKIHDFTQACKHEDEIQNQVDTFGVIRECMEILEPAESKAFYNSLEKQGLKVLEVSIEDFDLFRIIHNVIGSVEASSSCGKYDGVRYGHRTDSAKNWNEMYIQSRAESFGILIKTFLFQGAYFQFKNYTAFENACRIRARLVRKIDELFDKVDILAFPTIRSTFDAYTAKTVNDVYDAFSLTLMANVTGQPSVHIPGLVLNTDKDLGLQLIGPRMSDARLLSIANQLNLKKGDK